MELAFFFSKACDIAQRFDIDKRFNAFITVNLLESPTREFEKQNYFIAGHSQIRRVAVTAIKFASLKNYYGRLYDRWIRKNLRFQRTGALVLRFLDTFEPKLTSRMVLSKFFHSLKRRVIEIWKRGAHLGEIWYFSLPVVRKITAWNLNTLAKAGVFELAERLISSDMQCRKDNFPLYGKLLLPNKSGLSFFCNIIVQANLPGFLLTAVLAVSHCSLVP